MALLIFAVAIGIGIYSVTAEQDDNSPAAINKRALDDYLTGLYHDGNAEYPARLMIMGNVKGDDTIDSADLERARALVDTDYDYVENFLADANYDGLIDGNDIDMITQLMDHNGYSGVVNYINCDFKVKKYDMGVPVRTSNILTQTLQMLCNLFAEVIGYIVQ